MRIEIDQHSPSLLNFSMTDLEVAAEVGPSVLRRTSTLDQFGDFKKLSPFNLLGLVG